MRTIRSRAAAGAVIAALALSPVLTACGQAAEKAAEVAAEQALGGEGGDVDITDEGVTITDEEGNEAAIGENVAVPDTWPSEVPLYDGGTLQMVSVEGDGSASAMWVTDASVQDAAAAYSDALKAAGYTEDSMTDMGGVMTGMYIGNGYTVNFNAVDADGQTTVMMSAEKSA